MTLSNCIFVLNADASEGLYIVAWSCNPAKALSEGVVGVHDIPMTCGVRHRDGTFGPVVIPLGHLDKRQHREQEAKECWKHEAIACLLILTRLAGADGGGAGSPSGMAPSTSGCQLRVSPLKALCFSRGGSHPLSCGGLSALFRTLYQLAGD